MHPAMEMERLRISTPEQRCNTYTITANQIVPIVSAQPTQRLTIHSSLLAFVHIILYLNIWTLP